MPKPRRRRASTAPEPSRSDLGTPELRQHIDVAVLETIQAGVHVARTRCLHEVLYAGRRIGQAEYDAAERYRRDYETAAGARDGAPSSAGHIGVSGYTGLPDAQIDAQTALREAQQALGIVGAAILDAGAVYGASQAKIAAMLDCDSDRARLAFIVALGALSEHYEGPRRRAA